MELVPGLTCGCLPDKCFANKSTYSRHFTSKRHIEYEKRDSERNLRIRNKELENEVACLRTEIRYLQEYIQNPSKRQVSFRVKKCVAARAKWKCQSCDELVNENYEIDHILPLYKGGSNAVSNLQCLCPQCHRSKTAADVCNNR